jgi:hypothetical protein
MYCQGIDPVEYRIAGFAVSMVTGPIVHNGSPYSGDIRKFLDLEGQRHNAMNLKGAFAFHYKMGKEYGLCSI